MIKENQCKDLSTKAWNNIGIRELVSREIGSGEVGKYVTVILGLNSHPGLSYHQ
jgi:hypothetical protein